MNCSRCGQPLVEGAASCANCGAPAGAASPGAPQARPAGSGTQIPAYKFDAGQWTNTDKVTGVAAVVLLISLFLPWYGVSAGPISVTADGLVHGYLYIVLILLLVEIGYLAARAGWEQVRTRVPLPHHQVLLIINGINLVLVVIAFFDKYGSGVGWRFGAFVGLVAAVVAAVPKLANQVMNRRKSA